jgi:CO dehydrogenase maturation factor
MKVAFIGKGGAGKSTVCSLFIQHVLAKNQRVLAIDADINMHLAANFGLQQDQIVSISYGDYPLEIRRHLMGSNTRIAEPRKFVKTTPPGQGSKLVEIHEMDPIISRFATKVSEDCFCMVVGTYEKEGIGTSCYHTNLSIAENLLSHVVTRENEWVIVDMVAGSDMFAGAMHLLFDCVFCVTEPTPESLAVLTQVERLATAAGVWDRVFVVANKVHDQGDVDYLTDAVGTKLVAQIPFLTEIKRARQRGGFIRADYSRELADGLTHVHTTATRHVIDPNLALKALCQLHLRHVRQDYVIARHGDLTQQIDPQFMF